VTPRAPILALFALALAHAGCSSKSATAQGCRSDAECGDPQAFRCDGASGACRCRTSAACNPGEACNGLGFCQAHVGCYQNSDCPTGFLCDAAASTCIARGLCANDLQCPAGQLCDPATKACRPGCKSSGDCALREVCLCPASADAGAAEVPCTCDGLDAASRAQCAIGHCSNQTCADDSGCNFGEVCRAPPEGGLPRCGSEYDPVLRPYCDACIWAPGQETCGTGPNFCLYSTYTQSNYCGVDCSSGQRCANGYDCKDVIVVYTRTRCTSTDECAGPEFRSSIQCSIDGVCPNRGLCSAEGYCYGRCTFREGANESFCACVGNEDCAQDRCESTTRTCSISRRPCDLHGAGCTQTRCVDFGAQGGCWIGQNCKPLEGLTCADVRPTGL
jgi:Cys-rich repeat protein